MRADGPPTRQAIFGRATRPPASLAAARAPRAATSLRRREAWLRIFVVRCSLPCDTPVGGHSCNGGRIPRFHRAVCHHFTLGGLPKLLRLDIGRPHHLAPF